MQALVNLGNGAVASQQPGIAARHRVDPAEVAVEVNLEAIKQPGIIRDA